MQLVLQLLQSACFDIQTNRHFIKQINNYLVQFDHDRENMTWSFTRNKQTNNPSQRVTKCLEGLTLF
jgi:hypothetical protein